MVLTHVKPNNKRLNNGTRWDRIRKRQFSFQTLNPSAVKKFADMDFIGKTNLKILNGDDDAPRILNPTLVMDLRHKMSKQLRIKSPASDSRYKANINKCIVHNMDVEERRINHELAKFRQQLEKKRKLCKIEPKMLRKHNFQLNNKEILRSLDNSSRYIEDFYKTPLLAIEQFDEYKSNLEKNVEESVFESDLDIDLSNNNKQREDIDLRCVRFTDAVDILEETNSQTSEVFENCNLNLSVFADPYDGELDEFDSEVFKGATEQKSEQKLGVENELKNNRDDADVRCVSFTDAIDILGETKSQNSEIFEESNSDLCAFADPYDGELDEVEREVSKGATAQKSEQKLGNELKNNRDDVDLRCVRFTDALDILGETKSQNSEVFGESNSDLCAFADPYDGELDEVEREVSEGAKKKKPGVENELKNNRGDIDVRCVGFTDSVDILEDANSHNTELIEKSNSDLSAFPDLYDLVIDEFERKVPEGTTEQKPNKLEKNIDISEGISNITNEALKEVQDECSSDATDDSFEIEGCSVQKTTTNPLIVTKILPKQAPIVQSIQQYSQDEDDSYPEEQNQVITQIFLTTRTCNNFQILRNYFKKWIHYTTIQKIERENVTNKNDRVHQINSFMDHIRKEKKKCQTSEADTNPGVEQNKSRVYNLERKYKSKLKLQKDIIELQKHKLERQERMISELKLKKLCEDIKEDRNDIKAELKNVLRTGDAAMRAKAKCLQIMGNLRDEEDEELYRLQGKALIQPKFLTNMQERALERNCRHEEAKQRRLQKEAEREAAKAALEEAKRLEDEEAKRLRMEQLKEKRRQEKMAKVLKEKERQKAIENKKKAQQYCRYYLLRRFGMAVFKRALERKRSMEKQIELFRKRMIVKNTYLAWKTFYLLERERKICLADDFYEKIVKRFAFNEWKCHLDQQRSKYLVAVDWYDLKLVQTVFTYWCGYTKLEKITEDRKMKQAELHHEWHLQWKVLDRWQRLPQVIKLEKETEARRQRWRMKIWELLPDYTPQVEDEIL